MPLGWGGIRGGVSATGLLRAELRRVLFSRNVDALAEQNMEALRAELALDPSFGQEAEAAAAPDPAGQAHSEQTTAPMLE